MAVGLFDQEFRLEELSKMGDPLEALDKAIDFAQFRPILESAFSHIDRSKGGRPPFDRVMMFKALVLRGMYNLSFEKLEYLIKDRLSFQRFLGINLSNRVPDANTYWDFNEALVKAKVHEEIFEQYTALLRSQGLIVNTGSMIDASIVDAPIQRNTKEENEKIKNEGEKPSGWSDNKSRQKDADARWTKKNGRSRYGYKNHIKADKKSKLITKYEVTAANVHDSQVLRDLLEQTDEHHELYADSAYRSAEFEQMLKDKKIRSRIHKKAKKGNPLSEKDKLINSKKSKVRVRVEHVFGDMLQVAGRILVRQIGMARNKAAITMMNLTYNFRRTTYLIRS